MAKKTGIKFLPTNEDLSSRVWYEETRAVKGEDFRGSIDSSLIPLIFPLEKSKMVMTFGESEVHLTPKEMEFVLVNGSSIGRNSVIVVPVGARLLMNFGTNQFYVSAFQTE